MDRVEITVISIIGLIGIILIMVVTSINQEYENAQEWLESTTSCEDMRMYIMSDPNHKIVREYYNKNNVFWYKVMDKFETECVK